MINKKINLLEEDDAVYTSVTKNKKNQFNASNPNNAIFSDEDENKKQSIDNSSEKQSLLNQASEKIQSTLKNSDELKEILDKIKKLKNEEESLDWEINEAGNTAILNNKNARIFKQNNNLCLSYNNKVEIFKSVKELHDWLKQNKLPLPKDIKLHESSPWDNILNNITTNDGYKIGDTVPFTKEDLEDRQSKMTKPIVKMGRAEYKDAMKFLDKKKDNTQKQVKGLTPEELEETQLKTSDIWYLLYKTSKNDSTLYLNSEWLEGNLLTNNLDQAAKFLSKEDALEELNKVYTTEIVDAPFIPTQLNEIEECFGNTVSNSLGSTVQYTANTKKESEEDEELEEGMYGYPGTPFEKKYYDRKYARASDYMKWYNSLSDTEQRNVDPNEENYKLASKEMSDYQGRDLGSKHWASKYISDKDPDQMFRGMFDFKAGKVIDKEALIQRVKEVNEKYNLNINPNEPVITLTNAPKETPYKISDHNKEQRDKWIKDYYIPYRMNTTRGYIRKGAEARKAEYEDELKNKASLENDPSEQKVTKAYTQLLDQRNNPAIDLPDEKFFDLINKQLSMLNQSEQNKLLSKLVKAGEEGEVDINDFFLHILKSKITDKQESICTTPSEALLTEDDKPSDFADPKTIPNIQNTEPSSIDTENNTTEDSNKGSFFDQQDTDYTNDIDSIGRTDSDSSGVNFGDISLGGGSGMPSEDENFDLNSPVEPQYKIVDVLINEDDPSDIKLKLQNTETNEIETKSLYDVNI